MFFSVIGIGLSIWKNKKENKAEFLCYSVFALFILLTLPLGWNLFYVLTKGQVYDIIYFPFVLFYYLFAVVFIACCRNFDCAKYVGILVAVCAAFLLRSNIILAHECYIKKSLVFDATKSHLTKIISVMESTEGYIPQSTKVVFAGGLESNKYCQGYEQFSRADSVTLSSPDFSVTYSSTYWKFMYYVLNTKVDLLTWGNRDKFLAQEDVRQFVSEMPIYPQNGYCRILGNTLIVKLSE